MRLRDLTEATVPLDMLAPRYFHGSKKQYAKSIIAHGLQPPDFAADGRTKNYALRPVPGRVYLTPDAKLAALYGEYIFVINRESLVGDLQPDEDEVGDIYHWVMQKNFNDVERYKSVHAANPEFLARLDLLRHPSNQQGLARFKHFMNTTLGEKTRQLMLSGEYVWWAKGGKAALKKMPPELMIWLISLGVHVGHQGPIMPDEAWLISKRGEIARDGSNLAQVGTQIKLSGFTPPMPKGPPLKYKVVFSYNKNWSPHKKLPEKRVQVAKTFTATTDEEARGEAEIYITHTVREAGYRIESIERIGGATNASP